MSKNYEQVVFARGGNKRKMLCKNW